jgi:hypothetical protein
MTDERKKQSVGQEGPFLGGAKSVPSGQKRAKSTIKSTNTTNIRSMSDTHFGPQKPAEHAGFFATASWTYAERYSKMHTAMNQAVRQRRRKNWRCTNPN